MKPKNRFIIRVSAEPKPARVGGEVEATLNLT
jgi:hypothetical protein